MPITKSVATLKITMLVDTMDYAGRVIEPVYLHFLVRGVADYESLEKQLLKEEIIPIYDDIGNIVQVKYKSDYHRTMMIIKYGA